MSRRTKHAAALFRRGPRRWVAGCICGWRSMFIHDIHDARVEAIEHENEADHPTPDSEAESDE